VEFFPPYLGGGFLNTFLFLPRKIGEMEFNLTIHIFQMGGKKQKPTIEHGLLYGFCIIRSEFRLMISLLLVNSRCPRQEMAPGAATSIRRCLGEAYNEVLSLRILDFS